MIPTTALRYALKHRISLGRDCHGQYFVRHPYTLQIVESTRSARPTVQNAIAMMRRYQRNLPHHILGVAALAKVTP